MKIRSILALEGANVFSPRPVLKMFLCLGKWTEVYTSELQGFSERLVKLMPSLQEHFCSRRKPGGFIERLEEGTLLGHVVEHVALELMSLAGHKVIYGKTLATDEPGVYEIVMEYEVKDGAVQAARSAVEIVSSLLQGESITLEAELNKIMLACSQSEFGCSTKAIVQACQKRDIPYLRLGEGSLLQLGYGKYQKRVQATITGLTTCVGVDIACDKTLTKDILARMGIPVPAGGMARTEAEALELAHTMGFPIVIKPYNGNQGKGVSLNLVTDAQVRAAFNLARQHSEQVIVERFIKGKHYRVLVVGNAVEAAAERIAANVIGDGEQNIRELIDVANSNPLRGTDHELPLTKIQIDPIVLMTLTQKGYTLNTVPNKGEIVYLRQNANLSTGGTASDVTDVMHPSYKLVALRVAKIIGLDVAGIDLVTPDITQPFSSDSAAIIEVNAAPGIRMHLYPGQGKSRPVAEAIVNHLFQSGKPNRVPVVSVAGTNGKTTTTRMIAHLLRQRNLTVGMANSDGIWIGAHQVMAGDTTGPTSAQTVLCDPEVEAAVLETARGGILRAGLGYDFADVAVITNISEDHFGQYGIENLEDLAHVKSVVAEAVRKHSYVVLNADDVYVAKMASHTKGKVIFFSLGEENPVIKQHLGTGGSAVFIKKGRIIVATGADAVGIGAFRSFPVTLAGKALHNVQNVLAAVGAAWALGIPASEIKRSLLNFYSNPCDNPGRLNIYKVNDFQVMIDYGHNAAGIEQIASVAKRLRPKRLIGVVTVPGDRLDESVYKVGVLAGRSFDHLILREDADLRGRMPGEVAELLKAGALAAGKSELNIQIILSEIEAFSAALNQARTGDLVIEFYEKLTPVLDCLNSFVIANQQMGLESDSIKKMVL
ncbi:MAG: cyanophycin synthetase [Peptococcaceae bacterium]|nr:cyanophycin synthetase [Peptococcaceae bacterium]